MRLLSISGGVARYTNSITISSNSCMSSSALSCVALSVAETYVPSPLFEYKYPSCSNSLYALAIVLGFIAYFAANSLTDGSFSSAQRAFETTSFLIPSFTCSYIGFDSRNVSCIKPVSSIKIIKAPSCVLIRLIHLF